MGSFEKLLAELSRTRVHYEASSGNYEERARVRDQLHSLRSEIARLRSPR